MRNRNKSLPFIFLSRIIHNSYFIPQTFDFAQTLRNINTIYNRILLIYLFLFPLLKVFLILCIRSFIFYSLQRSIFLRLYDMTEIFLTFYYLFKDIFMQIILINWVFILNEILTIVSTAIPSAVDKFP